eukprot:tig00021137_g18978.t1
MRLLAWCRPSARELELAAEAGALDALRPAARVRLVAVIGPCRTGKSWLANQLCGQDVFLVTNGRPQTKGAELSPLAELPVYDAQLATPLLAVSSAVVLNIDGQGNFGRARLLDDVAVIEFVASRTVDDLHSRAHAQPPPQSASTISSASVAKIGPDPPFGALHIVYRNWTSKMPAAEVEASLLSDEASGPEAEIATRNARRARLRSAFGRIKVHCLPTPASPEAIGSSDSLPLSSTTAKFREALGDLRKSLLEDLRAPVPPFRAGLPAARCSGPMVAALLKELTGANAGGAGWSIPSALEAARDGAARALVEAVASRVLVPSPPDRILAESAVEAEAQAACTHAYGELKSKIEELFASPGNPEVASAVRRYSKELTPLCEAFMRNEIAAASQRLAAAIEKVQSSASQIVRSYVEQLTQLTFDFNVDVDRSGARAAPASLWLKRVVSLGSGRNKVEVPFPMGDAAAVKETAHSTVNAAFSTSFLAALTDEMTQLQQGLVGTFLPALSSTNERALLAARRALDETLAGVLGAIGRTESDLSRRGTMAREDLARAFDRSAGVSWPAVEGAPPSLRGHVESCKSEVARARTGAIDRLAAAVTATALAALRAAAQEARQQSGYRPLADGQTLWREATAQYPEVLLAPPEEVAREAQAFYAVAQANAARYREQLARDERERRQEQEWLRQQEQEQQRRDELARRQAEAQRRQSERESELQRRLEAMSLSGADTFQLLADIRHLIILYAGAYGAGGYGGYGGGDPFGLGGGYGYGGGNPFGLGGGYGYGGGDPFGLGGGGFGGMGGYGGGYGAGPSGGGRTIYTGPRGGQYYINGNGNRTYIPR